MKIAILTMVFNNNYGGMLQAYALQHYLQSMGHDVTVLKLKKKNIRFHRKAFSFLWRLFSRYILKKDYTFLCLSNEVELIETNTQYFVDKYIRPQSKLLKSSKDLTREGEESNYDAYIVGSDQVWRPTMYQFIDNAFLDFVKNPLAKKISYAPSFGTDEWEFTSLQTEKIQNEIKLFNAVSVREDSAIGLCRKYLLTEAVHVLDPTMLLDAKHYMNLVNAEPNTKKKEGNFNVYILDETSNKNTLVDRISETCNLKVFYTHYIKPQKNAISPIPAVTDWLQGFIDAEFVFTDSFHGCVFAILFNRPFIVYGNKKRGMARFNSLLRLFKLENRLVYSLEDLTDDILKEQIDWEIVNKILRDMRFKSGSFLKNSLSN